MVFTHDQFCDIFPFSTFDNLSIPPLRALIMLGHFSFKYVGFKLIFGMLNLNRFSNGFSHRAPRFFPFLIKWVPIPYRPPSHFSIFCPLPFWILVPYDLKCSWKLETHPVRVLKYGDLKFLVFDPQECTIKSVGESGQKFFIFFKFMKMLNIYPESGFITS